jgi:hypothetical protein
MAIPHYNYFPPAGQVVDASDGRVTWDGRAWRMGGRIYNVPTSHRLIGKAGTSYAGWYFDWQKHAWMQPSAATQTPTPSTPRPTPRPAQPRPSVQPRPQPQPQPQPQQPAAPQPQKEEVHMEKRSSNTMLDSLIKHPVAPVIGGILLLASNFTDEPQPPQITQDIPDQLGKQWQMIYNQNQQRFQRRMALYEQLGMVLLGYSSTQAVIDMLPAAKK